MPLFKIRFIRFKSKTLLLLLCLISHVYFFGLYERPIKCAEPNLVPIFCMILTKPEHLSTRATVIAGTWAKECTEHKFITTIPSEYVTRNDIIIIISRLLVTSSPQPGLTCLRRGFCPRVLTTFPVLVSLSAQSSTILFHVSRSCAALSISVAEAPPNISDI
jgi:hypothetical protein